MNIATTIAEALLSIGAVKVSMNPPFTWASGIKSPIYCDNRKLISHVSYRDVVVRGFVEKIKELKEQTGYEPEVIGGTATAAIPWAAFVAQALSLPMIYIRPEPKDHGAGKQVEGDIPQGKKVLIVEDLISTGGSSVKAAQAVRKECSATVDNILSIMTYELDEAVKTFADASIQNISLTNFTHLIGVARDTGRLPAGDVERVLEFKKSPREWSSAE